MLALAVKATPIEHFVPLVLYEQATPILHFFTSKVVLYIFGDSDAWLRLPSILIFLISINIGVRMLWSTPQRVALLVFVFSSPEIIRYSSEYKHYIFEFSFSLAIISAWLAGRHKSGYKIYAICALASIFLTYSVVLIVFSVFFTQFLFEKIDIKNDFLRKWFVFHLFYGSVFIALHLFVNKPSVYLQITNWPQVYNPGLLSENWMQYKSWLRLPQGLFLALGGDDTVASFSLLAMFGIYFSFVKFNKYSVFAKKSILLLILMTASIYIFSLLGVYPIQSSRHLLFAAPSVLFVMIGLFNNVANFNKIFAALLILLFVIIGILNNYKKQYIFQESENIIRSHKKEINAVFLGAQPAYGWYAGDYERSHEIIGEVNDASALRLVSDVSVKTMGDKIHISGAWPWIWSFRGSNDFEEYITWLAHSSSRGKSTNILFSQHIDDKFDYMKVFISKLPPECSSSILAKDVGVYLLSVSCQNSLNSEFNE